jgi:hypothetical protein
MKEEEEEEREGNSEGGREGGRRTHVCACYMDKLCG